MYYTTGFSQESIVDLCAMIHGEPMEGGRPWPPILGLFKVSIHGCASVMSGGDGHR
jgi:hypothetical protein